MCWRRLLYADSTSSEQWGVDRERGKYPVKIYTIDGVLIYQVENGDDNTNKIPKGGVVFQGSPSSSMIGAITNPITFYGNGKVISQDGHSGDLYNYYWTSYSRGTDGTESNTKNNFHWHNAYLDGYIPLRVKSIYDPCPYLYRIPSNGTWNQFDSNPGWTQMSYLGGFICNLSTMGQSCFMGLGRRNGVSSNFIETGAEGYYISSVVSNQTSVYMLMINAGKCVWNNRSGYSSSNGYSVRCIEDCAL